MIGNFFLRMLVGSCGLLCAFVSLMCVYALSEVWHHGGPQMWLLLGLFGSISLCAGTASASAFWLALCERMP